MYGLGASDRCQELCMDWGRLLGARNCVWTGGLFWEPGIGYGLACFVGARDCVWAGVCFCGPEMGMCMGRNSGSEDWVRNGVVFEYNPLLYQLRRR